MKAIPDGVVSGYLVHRSRPGQMLQLDQAQGDFVLPSPLAASSSSLTRLRITPVIGMLRNLFSQAEPAAGGPDHLVLLHSALDRAEVIFGDELRGYAAEGRLRLVELHTDVDGMLDVADLETIVPDLAEHDVRLRAGGTARRDRGPPRRGLPLHVEQFRPTAVVAGEAARSPSPPA